MDHPTAGTPGAELPPHVIEAARSGRSRCKACRRTIAKGAPRIGFLIEGPFGTGYLWHHLTCAARKMFDRVAEAYADEAWRHGKEKPAKLPSLETLRRESERAVERRSRRRSVPYVELAPSGRSRCKQCGGPIEQGAPRVVLGREVRFGSQVRTAPVKVHPGCVAEELQHPECAVEAENLEPSLRANSDVEPAVLERVLDEIRAR